LKISFVQKGHRVAIRGHGNARRVKSGEAVAIRMNGFFGDGIDGVSKSYSSFVPSRHISKMFYFTITYMDDIDRIDRVGPHSKFAPAHLLRGAQ
jgi:hypothetical protein